MILRLLSLMLLIGLILLGLGYRNLLVEPAMRTASFGMGEWPRGAPPMRVALLADFHVQGPDMPPERLAKIVDQVNEARPDLILLAGDFSGDRALSTRFYTEAETVAPLRGLRAPLGVYAVLGNHDHWRDGPAMLRALESAGIPVLVNGAVRRGPLTLVGADDIHTAHADMQAIGALTAAPGPMILLSHSPDIAAVAPARYKLIVAGHTHCGQIALPWWGPITSASNYGNRFTCGIIREPGRRIVVTAGLGASVLPLRFGAPPDWWLITLGPPQRR